MHPERVSALILLNSSARYTWSEDYPVGASPETAETLVQMLAATWGTPRLVAGTNPAMADNEEFLTSVARVHRASATPRTAATQFRYILENLDVRAALELVQAPTLVLNVRESPIVPLSQGRYMAERIPGASSSSFRVARSVFHHPSTTSLTRSRNSSPASAASPTSSAFWQRYCSPTSSRRPSERLRSGTEPGGCFSTPTTGRCVNSSGASAA